MNVSSCRALTRWRACTLLVVATLVGAACGGDDDATNSADTSITDASTTTVVETSTSTPDTETDVETTDAPPTTTPETTATDPTTPETTVADQAFWTGTAPNMTPVDAATAAEWQKVTEEALAASKGTPGAVVAVSDPDRGFWSAAVGDAELDVDPMTTDHHGRIGSITKTMTAVAVLQLVDQGKMNLDDTVAEVVPDIAEQFPPTADLTVEDLLSMTSGLPDYANVVGGATAQAIADPTKVWTPEDLIEAALDASDVQPVGTPGYSTTNFTILGRMYEAVTGDTIEDGVTRVASEAGLTETALLPGDQNDMPDPSTHGYIDHAAVDDVYNLAGVDVVEGTDVTDWSMSWGGAGGGAYSTINDLFLWASTGSGNTLLSTSLGDQRVDMEHVLGNEVYGLGLMSVVDGWVGHSGQAIGWEALEMYNPETGASIAIMVNSTSGMQPFYEVWNTIFDLGLVLG